MAMASRSSTTARVSRKMRRALGSLEPITASTATAKAMSVAVGMAQPRSISGPELNAIAVKITAGTMTPPTAAATGTTARLKVRRSPATNSRLSSSPAMKKKIARSPSAAHAPRLRLRCHGS